MYMTRVLALAITLTFAVAFETIASTQVDPALQQYVRRTLPVCPGSSFEIQRLSEGPDGFTAYRVTQSSSDNRCGRSGTLLVATSGDQIIYGDVIPVPPAKESAEQRLSTLATRLMKKDVQAKLAKEASANGLRKVALMSGSSQGDFGYHGWLDRSEKFLIIGRAGSKKIDPGTSLLSAIGASNGMVRGNTMGRIQIIEISDFQCPTCRRAHDVLEPFIKRNLNRISYTRLDLPLFENHDWVFTAALASRAIQQIAPAKYWDYVNYVFGNQPVLKKNNIERAIREFAEDNGIEWKTLSAAMSAAPAKKELLAQVTRFYDNGIYGTPTFLVNGQVIFYGNDGDHIRSHLESLLK
jgi:protein-disulfide isomerase